MAKTGLFEAQSPADASSHPPEGQLKPAPHPARGSIVPRAPPGCGAMPSEGTVIARWMTSIRWRLSTRRIGSCYENAAAESFFGLPDEVIGMGSSDVHVPDQYHRSV